MVFLQHLEELFANVYLRRLSIIWCYYCERQNFFSKMGQRLSKNKLLRSEATRGSAVDWTNILQTFILKILNIFFNMWNYFKATSKVCWKTFKFIHTSTNCRRGNKISKFNNWAKMRVSQVLDEKKNWIINWCFFKKFTKNFRDIWVLVSFWLYKTSDGPIEPLHCQYCLQMSADNGVDALYQFY